MRFESYSDFGRSLIGKVAARAKLADPISIRAAVNGLPRAVTAAAVVLERVDVVPPGRDGDAAAHAGSRVDEWNETAHPFKWSFDKVLRRAQGWRPIERHWTDDLKAAA